MVTSWKVLAALNPGNLDSKCHSPCDRISSLGASWMGGKLMGRTFSLYQGRCWARCVFILISIYHFRPQVFLGIPPLPSHKGGLSLGSSKSSISQRIDSTSSGVPMQPFIRFSCGGAVSPLFDSATYWSYPLSQLASSSCIHSPPFPSFSPYIFTSRMAQSLHTP